jgi:hypothetical protein
MPNQQRSFRKPRQNKAADTYVKKIKDELNQVKQAVNAVKQQKARPKPKGNRNAAPRGGGKITPAGKWMRRAGRIAGTFLGNGALGESVAAGISRITGQGDYQVQGNTLTHGGPPAFAAMNSGIRMAHREYVADVTSSTDFKNVTYDINPSNQTLFPWLSNVATNFEEYAVRGIVFYFNTTCGSAISSTNNALGTVGMVTVYDPTDPALSSKRECEDYGGCVAGIPASSLLHAVECKPKSNVLDRLYIQTTTLNNSEDKKFYSHGTLNLFTQGMQQAGVTIGELWVSYDIEFYNPKIHPTGTVTPAASKHYVAYTAASAQAKRQILGPNSFTFTGGNLGCWYSISNGIGYIRIPRGTATGYYMIDVTMSSPSLTDILFINSADMSSNLALSNQMQGNSAAGTSTPNAATANAWHGITAWFYKSDTAEAFLSVQLLNNDGPIGTYGADIAVVKMPTSTVIPGAGFYSNSALPDALRIAEDKLFQRFIQRLAQQEDCTESETSEISLIK